MPTAPSAARPWRRTPSGIASVANATPIPSGGFVNLDPFLVAQSEAKALGATITACITSPATALQLASLKTNDTDSNQPLLLPTTAAATGAPQRTIGVVRLWVSRGCADGVIGAPAPRRVRSSLGPAVLRGRRGVYPGVCEVPPATERCCATNHTAEAVRGSREPHSVRGSRPRVAGWPESRPELGDWRRDNSVPDPGSDPWVGL